MDETTSVELPTIIVEEAEQRCEEYGFPTTEKFVAHAVRNLLDEEPEVGSEEAKELLDSRWGAIEGETYSEEEVAEEVGLEPDFLEDE